MTRFTDLRRRLRDVLLGGLIGVGLGAAIAIGGLIFAGSGRGFPQSTSTTTAFAVFMVSVGAAGTIGGLLRPWMRALPGQLFVSFAFSLAFFVGLAIVHRGIPNLLGAAGSLAALTLVTAFCAREAGVFEELSGKDQAILP